ncbi:hypothetical protein SRHO_G00098490 [Serrasalmus rhombeus]
MLRLITECTVHEAHRTDRSWSLSVSELMAFIAVLFLRAVLCPIGEMTECWSAMFAVASIKETMPRDRYQEIMWYLRFDNKDTRPRSSQGRKSVRECGYETMKPYLGKGRTVATDNYFTSLSLANRLLESNTTLLGTMNKIRREIPLEAKNAKGREKLSTEVYR